MNAMKQKATNLFFQSHVTALAIPFPLWKTFTLLLALTITTHNKRSKEHKHQKIALDALSCLSISSTFPSCLCASHSDELHQLNHPFTHEYHCYITFLPSSLLLGKNLTLQPSTCGSFHTALISKIPRKASTWNLPSFSPSGNALQG